MAPELFEVDDERRTFVLTPHVAVDRDLVGIKVLRHVTFDGALAIFNTPASQVDGFDVTTYITWRRVTQPSQDLTRPQDCSR